LRVIVLGRCEQGLQREVARDDKAGEVGQELTAEVEDDEEQVQSTEAQGGVRLGDSSALLEVVKHGVLGQLQAGTRARC
jgi:hypothetical protein